MRGISYGFLTWFVWPSGACIAFPITANPFKPFVAMLAEISIVSQAISLLTFAVWAFKAEFHAIYRLLTFAPVSQLDAILQALLPVFQYAPACRAMYSA